MINEKQLQGKKILFLVTQTKWGGAQKYVLQLADYFRKKNEVHIAFGEIDEINDHFLKSCQTLGVKTIPVPNLVRDINVRKELSALFKITKIIRQGNYHLIHLNSSKAGLLGAIAGFGYSLNPINTRLRIIYTAHGFVFNEPGPPFQKRLFTMSETMATSLQTKIITVSDFDRQSAIAKKVCSEKKMVTIHNGLDFSQYNFYSQEEARTKLELDNNKKYFGTIASFYDTKGHKYLVEAIKLLKDNKSSLLDKCQWILIGDGPNLEIIKKLVREQGLEKYIKILPPTNEDWKYLKAFDYFVLPSVKEGLPYTILEAGLAQIPIVATKVGGLPEIITQGKTGLLASPANPLSLANTLRQIYKDNTLAQKLAANNYQNIKLNFSLKTTLHKTEELYLSLF
jgi:glycosyltransferase involved in cell wall biosynthesis